MSSHPGPPVDTKPHPNAPAWVEVDLDALARNAERLHVHAGRPLIGMVKADAYGHGAVPVVSALLDWSRAHAQPALHAVGVATMDEAHELRSTFDEYSLRILCTTPLHPDALVDAHRAHVMPSLHRVDDIGRWHALGGGAWHLAIDTGMQRAGANWDQVGALRDAIRRLPPAGVYTHFHSAECADGSRELQEQRFIQACAALGLEPGSLPRHLDNSAAIAARGASSASFVRPGLSLYGGNPFGDAAPDRETQRFAAGLEPIATVRARIIDLREVPDGETVSYTGTWRADGLREVATLGIGYGDGYRQSLGNRVDALLHDAPVPVVGRVTMDMTMIDVTGADAAVGDVVTLLGRDREAGITPTELATAAGISVYELFVGLGLRLPRVFRRQDGASPSPTWSHRA